MASAAMLVMDLNIRFSTLKTFIEVKYIVLSPRPVSLAIPAVV